MATKVGEVQGAKATLAYLRKAENDLYWKTVNRMKSAAKPLADAIDANFPNDPPMRGFDHNGRTGWHRRKVTTIKVGGRRKRSGDWPLLRIVIGDAPRQIFDMAASGNLNTALAEHGYGSASRAAWRTSDAIREKVTDDVIAVVKSVSKETNRNLRRVQ